MAKLSVIFKKVKAKPISIKTSITHQLKLSCLSQFVWFTVQALQWERSHGVMFQHSFSPLRPFHWSPGTFKVWDSRGLLWERKTKSCLAAVVLSCLTLADHYPSMKTVTPILNLSWNWCGSSSKTSEFHSSPFLQRRWPFLDSFWASQSTPQIVLKTVLIWLPSGAAFLNCVVINPQCHSASHVSNK